jgi:hypothetical protein
MQSIQEASGIESSNVCVGDWSGVNGCFKYDSHSWLGSP